MHGRLALLVIGPKTWMQLHEHLFRLVFLQPNSQNLWLARQRFIVTSGALTYHLTRSMNMRGNFSIACDTLNSGDGVDYLVGDTGILFANAVNNSIPASFPLTTVQTFVNVCSFCCLLQRVFTPT
jgi:hypothetical protein